MTAEVILGFLYLTKHTHTHTRIRRKEGGDGGSLKTRKSRGSINFCRPARIIHMHHVARFVSSFSLRLCRDKLLARLVIQNNSNATIRHYTMRAAGIRFPCARPNKFPFKPTEIVFIVDVARERERLLALRGKIISRILIRQRQRPDDQGTIPAESSSFSLSLFANFRTSRELFKNARSLAAAVSAIEVVVVVGAAKLCSLSRRHTTTVQRKRGESRIGLYWTVLRRRNIVVSPL